MANILPFTKSTTKKRKPASNTLCANGHHKWQIVQSQRFDVKQGKLLTLYRCQRCNASKSKAI